MATYIKTIKDTNEDYILPTTTAAAVALEDTGTHFTATNVEGAMAELFTSVSDGKTTIATAITDQGGTASGSDTFAELATAIGDLPVLDTSDATAVAGDILATKTAYASGVKLTGSMTNRGAVTITPSTSQQTISAGYHNGSGYVDGDADLISGNIKSGANIFGVAGSSSVVDTSDADAVAGDIATSKTAYVNGTKLTGTLTPITNLLGTLSFTGTYATDLSTRTYSWAFNPTAGHVLLVLQGANTVSYENVRFSLASAPAGITLLSNYTSNFDTSDPVGGMFGCIIQGVTAPINVSIAVNTRDTTYDFVLAALTVTYV